METIKELQERFNKLCDEQDSLNVTGFAEVFKALDKMEENFTPQHPYTENEGNINKALELTGHSEDEAFCKAFKRNNQIMIEGEAIRKQIMNKVGQNTPNGIKLIMMQGCEVSDLTMYPTPQPIVPNEWNFYPIYSVAPKDLQETISQIVVKEANEGKGLFSNVSDIPKEDEEWDKYFDCEVYGVQCSLQAFIRELQQYKVFSGLFGDNKELIRPFLEVLKSIVDFIKEHSTEPNKVRNFINEQITAFDEIPVWGLFYQILLLNGLCYWCNDVSDKLKTDENKSGYKDVGELWKWAEKILIEKEMRFCFTPYGDKYKKQLKPLCDYLYSTGLGKALQQRIFGDIQEQPQEPNKGGVEAFKLPTELDTAEARKVFQKAIEAGLMSETASGYKWQKSNVLLAFMCGVLYCGDTVVSSSLYREGKKDTVKLNKQNDFPETKLLEVFGVKNLGQSRLQKDGQNPPKGYKKILELIEEVRAAE